MAIISLTALQMLRTLESPYLMFAVIQPQIMLQFSDIYTRITQTTDKTSNGVWQLSDIFVSLIVWFKFPPTLILETI